MYIFYQNTLKNLNNNFSVFYYKFNSITKPMFQNTIMQSGHKPVNTCFSTIN